MAAATERELRERIAHYKGLQRMAIDRRALESITNLIAEAEEHIRQLELSAARKETFSRGPF